MAQQVQGQKQSTTNQLATFTYEPSSSASAISGTFDDLPATAAGVFYRSSMDATESIDMFEDLDNQLDVLGAQGRFIGSYLFQGPFARRRGGAASGYLPSIQLALCSFILLAYRPSCACGTCSDRPC